jgi:hypothetical protein
MSENLDLVRSIFAAWERQDFSRSDWADPEIEFVIARGPAPGHWKGLTAMAEAWRGFLSAWDSWSVEADEYRELDTSACSFFPTTPGAARRVDWT